MKLLKFVKGLCLEVLLTKYITLNMSDERSALSNLLDQLGDGGDKLLRATYSSERLDADLDNILFYNIHQNNNTFNKLSQEGICFEYHPLKPPNTRPRPAPKHYYRYELMSKGEVRPRYWEYEEPLVSWSNAYCPEDIQSIIRAVKNKSGAHFFWYALKSSTESVEASRYLDESNETPHFGVQVEMSIPKSPRVDLTVLEKALFDGIVSASHRCVPGISEDAIAEMSSRLGISSALFKHYLYNEDMSVLRRKQVIEKRYGYQWAPDDHSCVCGEIIVDDSAASDGFRFNGSLFTVRLRPPA